MSQTIKRARRFIRIIAMGILALIPSCCTRPSQEVQVTSDRTNDCGAYAIFHVLEVCKQPKSLAEIKKYLPRGGQNSSLWDIRNVLVDLGYSCEAHLFEEPDLLILNAIAILHFKEGHFICLDGRASSLKLGLALIYQCGESEMRRVKELEDAWSGYTLLIYQSVRNSTS